MGGRRGRRARSGPSQELAAQAVGDREVDAEHFQWVGAPVLVAASPAARNRPASGTSFSLASRSTPAASAWRRRSSAALTCRASAWASSLPVPSGAGAAGPVTARPHDPAARPDADVGGVAGAVQAGAGSAARAIASAYSASLRPIRHRSRRAGGAETVALVTVEPLHRALRYLDPLCPGCGARHGGGACHECSGQPVTQHAADVHQAARVRVPPAPAARPGMPPGP